jgi:uncharacterized protein YifN (PemK superfamily)
MPHAFRLLRCVQALGYSDVHAFAVGSIIERAISSGVAFRRETVADELFDAGFPHPLAEGLADAIRNCFPSERFGRPYEPEAIEAGLVQAGMGAPEAARFVLTLAPAVVTPATDEIRSPIHYQPAAGRVVMCDFRHLKKPEMQKERRAIVLSATDAMHGRCVVVPVSMNRFNAGKGHCYEFSAGSYPFFHSRNPVWAVCDHVYTVALNRLWRVNIQRRPSLPALSAQDFAAIKDLVRNSLRL